MKIGRWGDLMLRQADLFFRLAICAPDDQ